MGILLELAGFLKKFHTTLGDSDADASGSPSLQLWTSVMTVGMAESVVTGVRLNVIGIKLNVCISRNPNKRGNIVH